MSVRSSLLTISILTIALSGLALAACDTCPVCGRYVTDGIPDAFIRIDSNGACIGYEFMGGSWETIGDDLRITSIRGTYFLRIYDDALVDWNGVIWTRENT